MRSLRPERSPERSSAHLADVDPGAVRVQLERMVTHPLLKNSGRSRRFLKFVVEETLEGRATQLKERTVGIAVFGRDPEYDTGLDHIVRTAATDLRRRLGLYYQDASHGSELRILLPPGSYIPEFQPQPETLRGEAATRPPERADRSSASNRRAVPRWAVYAAALLTVAGAGGALVARLSAPRALDQFWAPVLASADPVLLCIGTLYVPPPLLKDAEETPSRFTRYVESAFPNIVPLSDATTLTRMAGFLEAKGKKFRVRGQLSSTLADLRDGPVVLVGAFNNNWSLRLADQLVYSLVWDHDNDLLRIQDRRHPSQDLWQAKSTWPTESRHRPSEDFALISRVWDPTTGRPVILAGGLRMWGTIAAGEFLTDPAYLEAFARSAPKDWAHKNIQIVIATRLIGENSGPPTVRATAFW